MATKTEKWLCLELGKLGIDSTEESARYILSMETSDDLEEYMLELLDGSKPKVRFFIQELKDRFSSKGVKSNNVQAYRKDKGIEPWEEKSKKKNKSTPNQTNQNAKFKQQTSNDKSNSLSQQEDKSKSLSNYQNIAPQHSGEIGVGAKKKTKYVPLYSKEGLEKSVVQLPGRHRCDCQASKHKLINNCVQCGRIVCSQEGSGPCIFCGTLVCSPEEMEILERGSRKAERLREQLLKGGTKKSNGLSETGQSLLPVGFSDQSREDEDRALKHRDKLLEYDKTSVRRTQVIDDECDYYATDSNQWLKKEEREKLRKREEELRQSRFGSRRDRKITFDIAGRNIRVLDADEDTSKTMYDKNDAVIQDVHFLKPPANSTEHSSLANPSFEFEPTFLLENEPVGWGPSLSKPVSNDHLNPQAMSKRIQDRELQEMSDEGMCLSMHQPWASLLICGIKMHEGRSWYSQHRGRLWIAATAKTLDKEEILDLEQFYKHYYGDSKLNFPKDYPSGCLLGCVNVDECLEQGQYREKYPDGESKSPYVFVCSNPSHLLVKFPMKGKHKIYKLEAHVHQAAKKGLR